MTNAGGDGACSAIACHTRPGVAGIARSVTPSGASALTTAFMIAAGAPSQLIIAKNSVASLTSAEGHYRRQLTGGEQRSFQPRGDTPPRWREMDSNYQFPARRFSVLPRGTKRSKSVYLHR